MLSQSRLSPVLPQSKQKNKATDRNPPNKGPEHRVGLQDVDFLGLTQLESSGFRAYGLGFRA